MSESQPEVACGDVADLHAQAARADSVLFYTEFIWHINNTVFEYDGAQFEEDKKYVVWGAV